MDKKTERLTVRSDVQLATFVDGVAEELETCRSDATRRMLEMWQHQFGKDATAAALRHRAAENPDDR